ncbi:MAG: chemotaxis protein CheX [Proteobacteria bacterium]|nr:chemotaxis protein CheX [Pseudomonadota bacterium]
MDANLVNPFIEATLNVLETTASTQATAGKPYLKKDPMARGDITGVIHLKGEKNATVSLSFSKTGILSIVSNMFGEPLDELNDDIKDAVGEIANMISGQVTNAIAQKGLNFKASLAEVILETEHQVPHIGKYPAIALPFEMPTGAFTIEVCFEQ